MGPVSFNSLLKFPVLLLFPLISIFLSGCSVFIPEASRYETSDSELLKAGIDIRVNLAEYKNGSVIIITSPVTVVTNEGSSIIVQAGAPLKISLSGNNISLTGEAGTISGTSLQIKNVSVPLEFRKVKYRGEFKLVKDGGTVFLLNVLDLEDYLRGVVPLEIGLKNPVYFEALKCAAVAARNFALMKIEMRLKNFDLHADTRDQAYGGLSVETKIDNDAVSATYGEILKYEGNTAQIFYFSSCGGTTEESTEVFSSRKIPYLTSVNCGPDAFCSASPSFRWRETYTANRLISILKRDGGLKGNSKILSVEITAKTQSGRVKELKFNLDNGSNIIMNGSKIRNAFRSEVSQESLRSMLFEVKNLNNSGIFSGVEFEGRGYGHGVGMCQWGALTQSKNGVSYERILELYFPGTKLEKMRYR